MPVRAPVCCSTSGVQIQSVQQLGIADSDTVYQELDENKRISCHTNDAGRDCSLTEESCLGRIIQNECAGKGLLLSTAFSEQSPGSETSTSASKQLRRQYFMLSDAFVGCVTTQSRN